jgi:hypothetical protein
VNYDIFWSNLTKVSESVRQFIDRDTSLRKNLTRGLINVRALAKYIQIELRNGENKSKNDREFSLDAIISAIRRYHVALDGRKQSDLLFKHMANKKLNMRNKIVEVAIHNDFQVPPALGRFSSQIDYSRGETFRMVAGPQTTRVIIDEKNLGKLLEIISKEKIKKVLKNLAEIHILLPESTDGIDAERVPGVVATLSSELTLNGISMTECMSCAPDIIILVEQKDAIRAYELIENLGPLTL